MATRLISCSPIVILLLALALASCSPLGSPSAANQPTAPAADPSPLAVGLETPGPVAQPQDPLAEPAETQPPVDTTGPAPVPEQKAWLPAIPAAPASGVTPSPTPALETLDLTVLLATSPDGWWQAEALAARPKWDSAGGSQEHSRVRIFQTDGNLRWNVIDEWREPGLGASYPAAFHWSRDGLWVYFYEHSTADGCDYFGFDTNLQRVSLEDGRLESLEVFEPGRGGVITISPGGTFLATLDQTVLRVRSLQTQEEFTISIEAPASDWDAGQAAWSPQENALAFSIVENLCGSIAEQRTSLVLVDLEGRTSRYLLKSSETPWVIDRWDLDGRLFVREAGGQTGLVDLITGAITPAEPDRGGEAVQALKDFLHHLNQGDYALAAELYGGSYEELAAQNPTVDPADHAALWQQACEINGYQCLKLRRVIGAEETSPGEYAITVELLNPDGSLFQRGPCCGEVTDEPPEFRFTFGVQLQNGRTVVTSLPVLLP